MNCRDVNMTPNLRFIDIIDTSAETWAFGECSSLAVKAIDTKT